VFALVAVVWAVYLSDCFARWRPGDWIFRRGAGGTVVGIDRPDVTFWNDRFAFVRTSPWPGDLTLRLSGDDFDAGSLRVRVEHVRRDTRLLRISAIALAVVLLVVFPALVLTERLLPWLPWLLGAVALTWSATLILFPRAYRRVHGCAPTIDLWLTHALSPISLICAPVSVALDVSPHTHPLAAARVLCGDDEFLRIARLWHFDSPDARPHVRAFAAARDLEQRLHAGPSAPEAGVSRFCPRCYATFKMAAMCCADCTGVTLVSLQNADPPLESSFPNAHKTLTRRDGGILGERDRTGEPGVRRSGGRAGHPRRAHRR
jgi:hypothetical protein